MATVRQSWLKSLFIRLGLVKPSSEIGIPDEAQLQIATEAGLVAAVEMILIQQRAMDELLENLEHNGIAVYFDDGLVEMLEKANARLNAAMKVAGEVIGLTDEKMRELFNE